MHANLEIRIFNPVGLRSGPAVSLVNVLLRFRALNHRMHNKVMTVDGRIGTVGGRNIADEYFDRDPTYTYIDREVLVLGPAVADMAASFKEYWSSRYAVPAEHLVSDEKLSKRDRRELTSMLDELEQERRVGAQAKRSKRGAPSCHACSICGGRTRPRPRSSSPAARSRWPCWILCLRDSPLPSRARRSGWPGSRSSGPEGTEDLAEGEGLADGEGHDGRRV